MKIKSIKNLLECVNAQGQMALHAQKQGIVRNYKADGSVITEIDKKIENTLCAEIEKQFPEANIISEESEHEFDPQKSYTFALDPIDGTDAYSQGMPGWCISLGLLKDMAPIAGIICAPAWGSLLYADVEGPAMHNEGKIIIQKFDTITADSQIAIDSKLHRYFDLRKFPGKIKSVGSTALHMCFPLIYSHVVGNLSNRACIWDFVGGHAIVKAAGYSVECLGNGKLNYKNMIAREHAPDYLLIGSRSAINALRAFFIDP